MIAGPDPERRGTRWLKAARAVASEEWVGSADLIATTGYRETEAALRLHAAEGLHTAGLHAAADEQLQPVLALYWRVGATLHLARAERLMDLRLRAAADRGRICAS